MEEFPRPAANLPDPLVRAAPVFSQPFQEALNTLPSGMRDPVAVFICEINRVHHLAINIELQLLVGCIANPDRPRILISRKMIQRNLVEILSTIKSIHNL